MLKCSNQKLFLIITSRVHNSHCAACATQLSLTVAWRMNNEHFFNFNWHDSKTNLVQSCLAVYFLLKRYVSFVRYELDDRRIFCRSYLKLFLLDKFLFFFCFAFFITCCECVHWLVSFVHFVPNYLGIFSCSDVK